MNLCSVEDPVEIPVEGLNQTQIHPRAGLPFRAYYGSRCCVRTPTIIMVGEIRDGETAEIAIKAAQTGHLVLSTLHTNSTSETLIRLQQMGVARWMISSALTLVVAQRLVRKLCPYCRHLAAESVSLPAALWAYHASPLASARLRTLLPRILWAYRALRGFACYARIATVAYQQCNR